MNAIRDKIITAEQFLAMEKDEHAKYELIDGTICMSPSPTFEHQKIASTSGRNTSFSARMSSS